MGERGGSERVLAVCVVVVVGAGVVVALGAGQVLLPGRMAASLGRVGLAGKPATQPLT